MTRLTKSVRRETTSRVFEAGVLRPVIVALEPPNLIAVRLKGSTRVLRITVDAVYWQAAKMAAAGLGRTG